MANMNKEFTIALVGRPNVGKSTFFNKIVGTKLALIDDQPGVTRDRKEAISNIGSYKFKVIDTPGLDYIKNNSNKFQTLMNAQTEQAISECDLVAFIIDGLAGVTEDDKFLAKELRKNKNKCVLLINKCENTKKVDFAYHDSFKLGLGEPVCISAEHKLGFIDFLEYIAPLIEKKEITEEGEEELYNDFIQLSIIGRPNAGKSTLLNAMLNEQRALVSPIAGTTRDSVAVNWSYGDYKIKLIDTAGLRKKTKVDDKIEKLSADETRRVIIFSQVVVVLLDATCFLEKQDLSIIDYVIDEGRALVVIVNKWDLVKNKAEIKAEIEYQVAKTLNNVNGVIIEYISALKAENLEKLMQSVIETFKIWNKRISTAKLNQWLREIMQNNPVPLNSQKKRPKIKFITQHKTRPPSFALKCSYPEDIDTTYQKFLINNLRKTFKMTGVPIRFILQKNENPYA